MVISPGMVLEAYRRGLFPMAPSRTSSHIDWIEPLWRGVLDPKAFRCPRRFRKFLEKSSAYFTINRSFSEVMLACAAPRPSQKDTWINGEIVDLYGTLHALGYAHSLEVWEDDTLVGGLYGLSLGQVFFGESMFSRRTNASKMAFSCLIARIQAGGFGLLDTQFWTPHLNQFGVEEIPQDAYLKKLYPLLDQGGNFFALPPCLTSQEVAHALFG